MRKKVTTIILSIMYSLFIVIGNSFLETDSFKYLSDNILSNIIIFIVLGIIIYFILNKIFDYLDNYNKKNKTINLFKKHPFLLSFIVILMMWLPYIIAYYPIILSPDPSFQIKQFFNIPNKYSTYVNLIDKNVIITNHHPLMHTLLLGTSLKIGHVLNNDNLGLFIYSFIQILVLSATLAYIIKFLKDKVSDKYLLVALLIFGLTPIFPFYAMSAVKDTLYTSFVILFTIQLFSSIKNTNKKNIAKLILLSVLVILFRNNGIYLVLITLLSALIYKKNKEFLLITLIILLFNFSYNNIILPAFKITPTSIREALSVPFQQTARYSKKYNKEVTKKEKEAIDKILTYDTLKDRYNSELSDPVKNEFNKDYTKKDLNKYFNVWFSQFIKHPVVYFEATISNTYGYFYPLKTNWYFYHKYDTRIVEDGFKYKYNGLKKLRKVLKEYGLIFPNMPIIGLLVNIAFNMWIILFMFMYVIYKKKYENIIYLMPSIVTILVCFVSPANTYFRYAMPYIFMMPLTLGLVLYNLKDVRK